MEGTMKFAEWSGGAPVLEIKTKPIMKPGPDEVLVKVAYTGICASDLHNIAGELQPPPTIPGHEFTGVVEEIGANVTNCKPGDRVVPHPVAPCGKCFYCHEGLEDLCSNWFTNCFTPPGGSFAEYVIVKEQQIYHLPQEISLKEGALIEPAAIAVHCMDQARIKAGQTVLVIGGGPIGLLTLQLVKLVGAGHIILSEPAENRRKIAKDLGADYVIDPIKEDLPKLVKEVTAGRGVDVAIEAVGNTRAIEQAFELLRRGGRLVIESWVSKEFKLTISPYRIFFDEIEIVGSFFSPYSFNRTIPLMHRLNLEPLMTHTFDLKDVNQALDTVRNRSGIKVLLKP